jgi:hypothetical protein
VIYRRPVKSFSAPSGIRVAVENSEPPAIDGERKTVTALFADIKGSTELEQDLDPRFPNRQVPRLRQVVRIPFHLPFSSRAFLFMRDWKPRLLFRSDKRGLSSSDRCS